MQYSMLENGMDFIISGILHLQKAESEKVNWKIKFQSIHPKNWNLVLQNIS